MAQRLNVLAVDPGRQTGWAHLLNTTDFDSGIIPDQLMFLDDVERWLPLYDVVVCEDYIVTQQTIQKSRQNYSLEIIGTLRWLCHKHGITFVLQTPSQAKSFADDDKLHKLKWYRPGLGHDNDASRHLLVYCINHQIMSIREVM